MSKIYDFIQQEECFFSIKAMCNLLNISRSAYYEYRAGKTYQPADDSIGLNLRVSDIFREHKRRYGARRIHFELNQEGVDIGLHQVRSVMKANGLRAIQPRSFVPKTTNSRHGLFACPNLLSKDLIIDKPNQAWVSDITYIPLANGKFVYLASCGAARAAGFIQSPNQRMVVGGKYAGSAHNQCL